jgi:hypothetical protein
LGTFPVYSLTIWEWRLSLRPGRILSDICWTILSDNFKSGVRQNCVSDLRVWSLIHLEGSIGRLFHFIFQNHFTLIKWGGFLDFKGAWPKILIKCVRVDLKIRVGRETLSRHIFFFFGLKTVLTLLRLLSLFILSSLVFTYFYVKYHRLLFLVHIVCQLLLYGYGYFVGEKSFSIKYSQTSVPRTRMGRIPWMAWTDLKVW